MNIEMTPSIHYDHDVTLKIKIEVSAESGTETISGVTEPIISQRVVDQTIRLREGEASILGGIQNQQEENNWTGIPGLSSIPILKYIFGSKDRTIQDDDIVFVVVPHIVRSQTARSGQSARHRYRRGPVHRSAPCRSERRATPPRPPRNPPLPRSPPLARFPRRAPLRPLPQCCAACSAPRRRPTPLRLPHRRPLRQRRSAAGSSSARRTAGSRAAASCRAHCRGPAAPTATRTRARHCAGRRAAACASLSLNAPQLPPASGATFQVPVVLNGATDVASIALQLHYDPAKLMLVNVSAGDFLSRDGQAAPPIHADQPAGTLVVGISRPPGTHGVSGTGVVCVLTFQAKASGPSDLSVTRASVVNSAQQQLQAASAQTSIVVK